MPLERKYICKFCDKPFTRKSWFDKHQCDKKRRFMNRHDIDNLKAHKMFNYWQQRAGILKKGKTKTLEEFCRSPLYNSFRKLTEFTSENDVVSAFRYIDWLVSKRMSEKEWFNKKNLVDYGEYLRDIENPEEQAEKTIGHIKEWCEKKDKDISNFFHEISPNQALNMIKKNQLSPWVLFSYDMAIVGLLSRFAGEIQYDMDEFINIKYWLDKISNDKESASKVQDYCSNNMV